MPKAKLTDEQKEEMYKTWLESPEALTIAKLGEKRPSAPALELATKDINTNI